MTECIDSGVHHAYVSAFLSTGKLATIGEVGERLSIDKDVVTASLRRLESTHGMVLHPHVAEPWVIHPFSASPTATWVESGSRGWWAPCMWCACGIATLAERNVDIHARLGGEARPVTVRVRAGEVIDDPIWIHFAQPPRDAWNNVHHFCATVLPFQDPSEIESWADRHGLPVGAAVPIAQTMTLARLWYGRHADRDWKKWSIREASGIFESAGLTGDFWSLEGHGSF